jgi:hypothetical protein
MTTNLTPTTTNPIQIVEQEILDSAVTEVEQLTVADPLPIQTPTIEQKRQLAGEIWLANGGLSEDPRTLNHWLQAEAVIESGSQLTEPTE